MLLPLTMGLPIVTPQSLTGPQLLRAIREGAVTAVLGVPRLFEALCSGIEARAEAAGPFAALLFEANLSLSRWLRRCFGLRLGKLLLRPVHQQLGPPLRLMACGGAALASELAWKLEALLGGFGPQGNKTATGEKKKQSYGCNGGSYVRN